MLMRRTKEMIIQRIFFVGTLVSVMSVILICIFLFINGVPAILQIGVSNFVMGTKWAPTDTPSQFGVFPMILGSVYITLGAALVGVPIGLLTAVYLTFFCPKPAYRILKPCFNLLAGIPSIVYGFWGLTFLVPIVRTHFGGTGKSVLTASILLGIMILPTIISVSESTFKAIPIEYYEGALALGASKNETVFRVLVPSAKSGVMAAIVLGVGRAIGETMGVVMVAGNQAVVPKSLIRGVRV